jgi:hypothetical protein
LDQLKRLVARIEIDRPSRDCALLIGLSLIVQVICRYSGVKIATGVNFDTVTLLVRLAAALLVLWVLAWPSRTLGFARPQVTREDWIGIAVFLAVICIALFAWRNNVAIRAYYRGPGAFRNGFLQRWLLFVFSATLSWELLHRGMLLFGLKHVLEKAWPSTTQLAVVLPLLITWSFETLFHFTKVMPETMGMIFLSPALSILALRTRSILLPMAVHAIVELMFYWFTLANL